MAASTNNNHVTMTQALVPLALMAFTMALLFAIQTKQIFRDRDALHEARGQQAKPYEEAQRLESQLRSLIAGTRRLADDGHDGAKAIVRELRKAGVIGESASPVPSPAPVPAAREIPEPGPVKP